MRVWAAGARFLSLTTCITAIHNHMTNQTITVDAVCVIKFTEPPFGVLSEVKARPQHQSRVVMPKPVWQPERNCIGLIDV